MPPGDHERLLTLLGGAKTPTAEEFKELVVRLDSHRILAKVFLLEGTPYVFEQSPMKYVIFREQVADQFEDWCAAGVDGFNLAHTVLPGGLRDFVDGVVPVLQQRGRMQREYQPGTLREKLFPGGGARLAAPHPAAAVRRP